MKTCFKCKKIKELSSFYQHPQMADGHLNKCKECTKRDAWLHRKKNPDRVRDSDRRKYQKAKRQYLEKFRERTRIIRAQLPERNKAYTTVYRAIKSGTLTRPDTCSLCGMKNHRIEAHHADYSQPLDVQWLCSACHKIIGGQTVTYDLAACHATEQQG